ncbi:MAG TPA: hypothetical protein DCE78_10455 [Bacteroidetes bacterium]|nr:hypothetical protein [Bacteroidota bacterium]
MSYPWYKVITESSMDLNQGDLIPNCPIVIPPSEITSEGYTDVDFKEIDSIIMTQSCDLSHEKVEIVLVCPYYSLSQFLANLPSDQVRSNKAKRKVIEQLRKGYLPSYHLLNKDVETPNLDEWQVVDFRNVYGIHFSSLLSIVDKLDRRVRLLPPYREHLSQSFARYFMRVGLPQDIVVDGY